MNFRYILLILFALSFEYCFSAPVEKCSVINKPGSDEPAYTRCDKLDDSAEISYDHVKYDISKPDHEGKIIFSKVDSDGSKHPLDKFTSKELDLTLEELAEGKDYYKDTMLINEV